MSIAIKQEKLKKFQSRDHLEMKAITKSKIIPTEDTDSEDKEGTENLTRNLTIYEEKDRSFL